LRKSRPVRSISCAPPDDTPPIHLTDEGFMALFTASIRNALARRMPAGAAVAIGVSLRAERAPAASSGPPGSPPR